MVGSWVRISIHCCARHQQNERMSLSVQPPPVSVATSVTSKNRLMSIKVAQKLSHRKMNDFHIFTKMPNNVSNLGKIVVATGFECLPKKQKNRPIWSYWSPPSYIGTWYCFEFLWIGRKVFFVVLCYSLLRKSILCEQSKKYQSLVGLETIVEALIYW